MPIIEMLDVAVVAPQHPETAQLEGVNWSVTKGEFWVVGGLHGSGKSNLLVTAAGLQNPLRGIVKLYGRDASQARERDLEEERRRIGVVFEDGGRTFGRLTVRENIALPLRYHANLGFEQVDEHVRKIVDALNLSAVADQLSKTVSSGWQQRVALARALTRSPDALLLDKPLSAVETRQRRWWFDFLPKLFSGDAVRGLKPMTIVITTDDIEPWADIGTHFALLKNKRWQFLGNGAELMRNKELWRDLANDEFLL